MPCRTFTRHLVDQMIWANINSDDHERRGQKFTQLFKYIRQKRFASPKQNYLDLISINIAKKSPIF